MAQLFAERQRNVTLTSLLRQVPNHALWQGSLYSCVLAIVAIASACTSKFGLWEADVRRDQIAAQGGLVCSYQVPMYSARDARPARWVAARFRTSDTEPSDAGLLIPLSSHAALDADTLFQQAFFFPSTEALQILLRDAVRDAPVTGIDVRQWIPRSIDTLVDYGATLPEPADAGLAARTEFKHRGSGGLYIVKLRGQANTAAAIVMQWDDIARSEEQVLRHGWYVRTSCELKGLLSAMLPDDEGTVLLMGQYHTGIPPEDTTSLFVPFFALDDEMISWIPKKP
jgi:hypothetical protein